MPDVAGSSVFLEIERLLGLAAPHIKAEHLAEAAARGLGAEGAAVLRAATRVRRGTAVEVNRDLFETCLAEHGYDAEGLQIALLPDAVRLATGAEWKPSLNFLAAGAGGRRPMLRECLSCFDPFCSSGAHNLLCNACKERDHRLPGVQHAGRVLGQALTELLHSGKLPSLDKFRVRPGWSDVLDGSDFKASIATTLAVRAAVLERRWRDVPKTEKLTMRMLGEDTYLSQFSMPVGSVSTSPL